MFKNRAAAVRVANEGDEVVTCIGGIETARKTASGGERIVHTCIVGDEYLLPEAAFKECWEVEGTEPTGTFEQVDINDHVTYVDWKDLIEKGFKQHKPKGEQMRQVYRLTRLDLCWFPTKSFVAKFGSPQPVTENHF